MGRVALAVFDSSTPIPRGVERLAVISGGVSLRICEVILQRGRSTNSTNVFVLSFMVVEEM